MSSKGLFGAGRGHLDEAGMGYGAHFKRAARVGTRMLAAGGARPAPRIFPGIFSAAAPHPLVKLNAGLKQGHNPGQQAPALLAVDI